MEPISLGSINKKTGEYVYPNIANKEDNYMCPDCNKDLVFCKGLVRSPYFRHKVEINSCSRYNNPTESQIHLDAKMIMKSILEQKMSVSFTRVCNLCQNEEIFEIPEISSTSSIQLEHRFNYNGIKIADIAYIDNNDIMCIFEICNTHKTSNEDRPEPWFEIDASTLIKTVNMSPLNIRLADSLKIPCIRNVKCDECKIGISPRTGIVDDNIKQALNIIDSVGKRPAVTICKFCQQKNKVRCCIWNSYFKQTGRIDWDSTKFAEYIQLFKEGHPI